MQEKFKIKTQREQLIEIEIEWVNFIKNLKFKTKTMYIF